MQDYVFQDLSVWFRNTPGKVGLHWAVFENKYFRQSRCFQQNFLFFSPTRKLFYLRIFSSPISRLDHLVTAEISARFLGVFLLLLLCFLKSPNFLSALFQRVGISCMWNRRCCRNKIEKLQCLKWYLKIHMPWGEQSFKKDD